MAATRSLRIAPPSKKDLDAAEAAWRDGTLVHEVPINTRYWRVLRAVPPADPLEYAKTCYPSDGDNRFTPMYSGGKILAAAYAGSTQEIALWEVILRDIRHKGIKRVPRHETTNRYLVEARTTRVFKLLDLRRPKDANIVSGRRRPPKLTAAPRSAYGVTRAWAQALYDRLPEIDGLIYESHQVPGDCIVLWQSRQPEVFKSVGKAQPVNTGAVRRLLSAEARKAGAVVDFGDLVDD